MNKTCCFLGHRNIEKTVELSRCLCDVVEELITSKGVTTFLFGSKSQFNSLCYETVTCLKENYPNIRRIYVRGEYPVIKEEYKKYLLEGYEDTYFPERLIEAGKAVYVERNIEMINRSNYCVVYYDPDYSPLKRKSGTKTAIEYALKTNNIIINLKKE